MGKKPVHTIGNNSQIILQLKVVTTMIINFEFHKTAIQFLILSLLKLAPVQNLDILLTLLLKYSSFEELWTSMWNCPDANKGKEKTSCLTLMPSWQRFYGGERQSSACARLLGNTRTLLNDRSSDVFAFIIWIRMTEVFVWGSPVSAFQWLSLVWKLLGSNSFAEIKSTLISKSMMYLFGTGSS